MHGKSVAVVVSRETFDRLSQAQGSLVDFMQRSPLFGTGDVEFERDAGLTRETGSSRLLKNDFQSIAQRGQLLTD